MGMATALVPARGDETASRIARRALAEKRSISELVLEEGLLPAATLEELFDIEGMTAPTRRRSP
ncbi:aspartate ammonia-lyase [compost metagenome]